MNTTRLVAVLVLAALVAAAAGTFAWKKMQALQADVGRLNTDLSRLAGQLEEAQTRAEAAQRRAEAAEGRALEAEEEAQDASEEAEAAETRAEAALERANLAEEDALEAALVTEATQEELTVAAERSEEAQNEADRAKEEARIARLEAESIRRQRERELDRLERAMSKIAETRRTAMGVVMNLGDDRIEFDFDKAELRSENRELLARIAGVLLTAGDYQIQVFGHTDDVGSDEYNQTLSQQRARVVRDYLVEAGIEPAIITTKGFGKSRPLVQGTDSSSRQRNRRVEIGIIQTDLDYTPVAETVESDRP